MTQVTIGQAIQAAFAHHQAGRLPAAEELYHQILAREPDHVDALHLLGILAAQTGRLDNAVAAFRRAVELRPDLAAAYSNLSRALRQQGKLDDAIAAYRRFVELKPTDAFAHGTLGNLLLERGNLTDAIASHTQAVRLRPDLAPHHNNLGAALAHARRYDEAIDTFRNAIHLSSGPDSAIAHNNLGKALLAQGTPEEAISAFHAAIRLRPDDAEAHSTLGTALHDMGCYDQATAAFRAALAIDPACASAHWNLALSLLQKGEFALGWQEYEWRWRWKDFPSVRRNFRQPLWTGSQLTGRTILLHAEQGLGDALQFIRYVPLVAQRGARVILECPPELLRLLLGLPGIDQLIASGQTLPDFDLHCPLLSLPAAFGTTLGNIPNSIPYLQPAAPDVQRWAAKLAHDPPGYRVGLAWAGSATHVDDRRRSIPLDLLAPLAQAQDVVSYSLQKRPAARQSRTPPSELRLIDHTAELNDFADTAALMAHLDLLISVDTAVAHLAGAMGKEVWMLLPFVPDWRWMLHRPDTPWYPTMRLCRQSRPGDWPSVIGDLFNELRTRAPVACRPMEASSCEVAAARST